MKIAVGLGSPRPCELAEKVTRFLESEGHAVTRFGTLAGKPSDYIDAASELGEAVKNHEVEQGVLFCNTGTGVTIIANKIPGVRAALCLDSFSANVARQANNANVLVLSIRMTKEELAMEILDEWLRSDPKLAPDKWKQFHVRTETIETSYRAAGGNAHEQ